MTGSVLRYDREKGGTGAEKGADEEELDPVRVKSDAAWQRAVDTPLLGHLGRNCGPVHDLLDRLQWEDGLRLFSQVARCHQQPETGRATQPKVRYLGRSGSSSADGQQGNGHKRHPYGANVTSTTGNLTSPAKGMRIDAGHSNSNLMQLNADALCLIPGRTGD
ncbi:hypothetical protein RB213_011683 [Colletotrichum asianum]